MKFPLFAFVLLFMSCGAKPESIAVQPNAETVSLPSTSDAIPNAPASASGAQPLPSPPASALPSVPQASPSDTAEVQPMPSSPSPSISNPSAYNPCPSDKKAACIIMPFGASTTAGNGSTHGAGYRLALMQMLRAANQNYTYVGARSSGPSTLDGKAFPKAHSGFSGTTIDESKGGGITKMADGFMATYKPHIVLLEIGGNDVNQNFELDAAPARLGLLVDKLLKANPATLVIVAKILPAQNDTFNERAKKMVAGYETEVNKRIAAGKHVMLVDVFTAVINTPNFKKALYTDNLHPNDAGYKVEAGVWLEALKTTFR